MRSRPAGTLAPAHNPLTDEQKVLIEEHLPFVTQEAVKMGVRWRVPEDEAGSIGAEVLVRFVRSATDLNRVGTTLNTFLGRRLERAFSRNHRRQQKHKHQRLPTVDRLPTYEEDYDDTLQIGTEVVEHVLRSLPTLFGDLYELRIIDKVMLGEVLIGGEKSHWYRHMKPKLREWAEKEGLV